ncbi:MAG: hypothetical protein JST36_04730 [Bacteroidetes bacterium]|nr:hypothetical protein [Bacteroidota bacterium]
MQHYSWLLQRLDAFIRKYYLNQVLRGTLIVLSCLLAYFLLVSISEYYLFLPVWAKLIIIALFVVVGGGALVFWILKPLAQMFRMGKTLSHEQAAIIIGKHFPEVQDKLLNILQLRQQDAPEASRELVAAAIDQKSAQLALVPIVRAIDLSRNKRYLPFLLPLLLIGIFILVAAPNVFRDAGTRLLHPTKAYEKPAPFQFNVLNAPLSVVRNGDFVLKVALVGSALPAELSLAIGSELIPAEALSNHVFQYRFKQVTAPLSFRLKAAGFYSGNYTLNVVQQPELKAMQLQLDYPAYTGKKRETRSSLGDLLLPVGTKVSYALMANYTDVASFQWASGAVVDLLRNGAYFNSTQQYLQDTSYTILLKNRKSGVTPSYQYKVQVIPDQYPIIQLQEFRDTVSGRQIVLTGTAGDDYGISSLSFHYTITNVEGQTLATKSFPLHGPGATVVPFQQYFDLQVLQLQPGQRVTYFIEAKDNDGIHGPKAARSQMMSYSMYTPQQLDSSMQHNAKQINAGLSSSAAQAKQLEKDIKETQEKMLQSTELSFEQQQNLKDLFEKQEALKNQLEVTKKRLEEQKRQSSQKPYSEDIKEKQEAMEKQLDNLLNNELKEQMKKLQDLMAKLNKEDAKKTLDQIQEQNKLFNMDMERMKELMKQLEAQMRMEDLANKIDKLAQQQLDLKAQTDAKKKENANLAKAQNDLKRSLDSAMAKDMKDLAALNKEMKQKQNMESPAESGKNAQEEMKASEENLEEGKKENSSKKQQEAAEHLQEMANSLRKMAGGLNAEQIEIDIRATRQLLTNLIRLSFDQEKLMAAVQTTSAASNAYLSNQSEQGRLHQASRMIRDSLFSLSKRVFKLAPNINKETTELERNMALAKAGIESRRIPDVLVRQQYVMTHTNNLALMLNELLANLMQMQSQSQSKGNGPSGACIKPGSGKPGGAKPAASKQLADIITEQQGLGQSMKSSHAGNKPGEGKKPGEQGKEGNEGKDGKSGKGGKTGENGSGGSGSGYGSEGNNEYGDAEKLARLAEQQAQIRRQLQDLQQELNGTGVGDNKLLREIQQQMDRNETDLVNRRLSAEFLARQQQIMSRLLEAEKAIREQEQDNKRQSNAGKEMARPVPPELQPYLKNNQQLLDYYKTIPPQLKPYFKQMVDQYFNSINN